eukprot:2881087-Amphidinium_carterae.1
MKDHLELGVDSVAVRHLGLMPVRAQSACDQGAEGQVRTCEADVAGSAQRACPLESGLTLNRIV